MREFYQRALKKLDKLTAEQTKELLVSAAGEIDRLESVLDSLNEGIVVADGSHNLVMANRRIKRYLPPWYDQENVPIWELAGDDRLRDFLERALTSGDRVEGREFDIELQGKPRLVAFSVLPLVRDRQVSGSLVYAMDVTERRGKEAQLRRAETLASLTTLAAGVAHEIKNPLGSLSIHVQLVQRAIAAMAEPDRGGGEDWPGEVNRYIAVVNEEIDRLNRIVVDFLFAVRPMNLELREGSANAVIRELVEFVRYELEEARISCRLDLDDSIPLISLDERFMKQALLNLIKNAIAAMPGGGDLSIRTVSTDTDVVITVADSGTGISEANLHKIFEPYFTTRESGNGLGLTLVFKIVREHRGEIGVKSREGEGTSFIITLPVPQKETRLLGFDASPAALPPGLPEGKRDETGDPP